MEKFELGLEGSTNGEHFISGGSLNKHVANKTKSMTIHGRDGEMTSK
jgi:hypothetical protein